MANNCSILSIEVAQWRLLYECHEVLALCSIKKATRPCSQLNLSCNQYHTVLWSAVDSFGKGQPTLAEA